MRYASLQIVVGCALVFATATLRAQTASSAVELRLHLALPQHDARRAVPAVLWLEPVAGTAPVPFVSHGPHTLLQKNRTFLPHLQVVPVGTVVQFPNADPFFHNVFSLFDGRRFDLGLYEAGTSKAVTFSREGVSYVFCNIHPEMSAVVLALSTPLYSIADANDSFALGGAPAGDYRLHVWVEGIPQTLLDSLTRPIHLTPHNLDLGTLTLPTTPASTSHTNKFGKDYNPQPNSHYEP